MRKLALGEFQQLGFNIDRKYSKNNILLTFRGKPLEVLPKPPWWSGADRYYRDILKAATLWVKRWAEESPEWAEYVDEHLRNQGLLDKILYDTGTLEEDR